MRDTGPARKTVDGDQDAALAQMGAARVQLGILKNGMRLGGLTSGMRTIVLEDGTEITVSSINGQDSISVNAPAAVPVPVEPLIEPPPAVIEVPELIVQPVPGNTEIYSQPYSSAILLGAVTDKTTKTTFLAYAAPGYEQGYAVYQQNVQNQSQLVQLDANLKEVSRSPVAMPDWGGQLTYDIVADCFFMNAFAAVNTAYTTHLALDSNGQAHFVNPGYHPPKRSVIRIEKGGSQLEVPGQWLVSDVNTFLTDTSGQSQFAFGNTMIGVPATGGQNYEGPDFDWDSGYGSAQGTSRAFQVFPVSQPSTSGVIACMFRGEGDFTFSGPNWVETDGTIYGFVFLWDTRTHSVVWRGTGLGTYTGSFDPFLGWQRTTRYDPWAHVTPTGNLIVSVTGQLTAVQAGGAPITLGSPPPGIVDIVMTKGDKAAYGITTGGAYHYREGNWAPIALDGAPIAVLHDSVTDAVAIVLGDGSGAWILNAHTAQGQSIPSFKLTFAKPPVTDPTRIYPQQFINGTLLITYALPWDGTRGVSGPYIFSVTTSHPGTTGNFYNWPRDLAGQRHMEGSYFDGQRPPAWRAQLGMPATDLSVPNYAVDGAIDPVQWIIGRYDIGALKQ